MSEEEREGLMDQNSTRNEKEEENMYKRVPHYLHMEWVGANPKAEVVAEEKVSHYYTYPVNSASAGTIKADAYKKIIYKNLYPGLTVDYIMPDDKRGLKCSVILHPGADVSLIRMKYSN